MRFTFLLLIFLSVILTNCTNDKTDLNNSLHRDTMVQIIAEMHLADAILISPKTQQSPKKINSQNLYFDILKKHNITNKIFEDNLKNLSVDTIQFKTVYEDVIKKLSIMQGDIMSIDSIAKK